MKKILLILCLSLAVTSVTLAKEEKSPTPQQQKMATCNKDASAKGLKGDARKQFMSECLSHKDADKGKKKLTPQQQKMADCNKQAGANKLKGDERKKFMSQCLKTDRK
jgi:hypothetical protein